MEKLKLSQLKDEVEISIEGENTIYTVAELKREILELGEAHHETDGWHTAIRQSWKPSAEHMLDTYIDNEYQEMYEDWDERAWDVVKRNALSDKIQKLLDEAFNSDYATAYWTLDKPVEIDIFPKITTA